MDNAQLPVTATANVNATKLVTRAVARWTTSVKTVETAQKRITVTPQPNSVLPAAKCPTIAAYPIHKSNVVASSVPTTSVKKTANVATHTWIVQPFASVQKIKRIPMPLAASRSVLYARVVVRTQIVVASRVMTVSLYVLGKPVAQTVTAKQCQEAQTPATTEDVRQRKYVEPPQIVLQVRNARMASVPKIATTVVFRYHKHKSAALQAVILWAMEASAHHA